MLDATELLSNRTEYVHGNKFLPQLIWLEITRKCNLVCAHCYNESGPDKPVWSHMKHEDWLRVISEAAMIGFPSIQFIGGEPFIHPKIEEYLQYAVNIGFQSVEVFTNATPITAKRAKFIADNNIKIAISIYGPNGDIHDLVTGKVGSFEQTISNVQILLAEGVNIRAGFVETSANTGEFSRTRDALKQLGVFRVGFDRARLFGRELSKENIKTSCDFSSLCGQCDKGKLCITNDGTVYPCIMSRQHKIGNVLAGDLTHALESIKLKEFSKKLSIFGKTIRQNNCEPENVTPQDECGPWNCSPMDCIPTGVGCNPDANCIPDGVGCHPNL